MTTSAELEELLDSAKEAVQNRDYTRAISLYRQIIDLDEFQVAAHEGLARAAFLNHDYDAAIQHFTRVSQLDPRRSHALVNVGAVQNRKGDYPAAVLTLRKALVKDHKSAEAYYNLGLAHRGLNQLTMAVSAYKEAIRLNPEMSEAYQNLANVFVAMGNADQAILQYRRALEIRPDFERAQQGLERAQAAKRQAENSKNPFGRLVDITKVKKAGSDDSFRRLTDEERSEDREFVHEKAKEAQRAATAIFQLLQTELEPDLLDLTRAVNQSKDVRGFLEEFNLLKESIEGFTQLVETLEQQMDEFRIHELENTRLLSQASSE